MKTSSPSVGPEKMEIEQLRFALNASGIGTWDLDPVARTVKWDERCRALFDLDSETELSYEAVLQGIHPDDAEKVNNAVMLALDPATAHEYDVRYRTKHKKDGQHKWVASKGKAYFNDEGVAYRFAGTTQDISQMMQEHDKLIASEKIAQVALENSNSGYFRLSLTDNSLEYSPGFSHVLTGSRNDHLNRSDFLRHLHPDDLSHRAEAFKEAEKSGKLEYECRVIWDDGSIHWMRAKGTYLLDGSAQPAFLTGTIYDTTAEHQKQETIAEAEKLLGFSFSNASIGMAFADLNGRFIKVNPAYTALLGYTEKELELINYVDLTHPGDQQHCNELFHSLASGAMDHFAVEKRYLKKDGSYTWVHCNVTYIKGVHNEAPRIMCITRDINTEKLQSQALAATQAMLRNVSSSSPTGLWLSDCDGGLTYLNKTLADWTGMAYDDLLGAGWANAIIDEDRQRSAEIFLAAVAKRSHYDTKFRMRKSDGTVIWCHAAGDPFFDEDGQYAGYAGFCMDIDELMSGREALQKSESKFRTLVEEAPVATCLFVGPDQIIEVANDIILGYWGKDRSVIGMPLMEAIPELEGQPFPGLLKEIYKSGKTFEDRAALAKLMNNGVLTDYYFDYTYKPLFNENGEIYAIMDMAIDVTEQVMANKLLEESEFFSRYVIDNSPVAKIVFTGNELTIKTANQNMLSLLGVEASIIGQTFDDALPAELSVQFKELLLELMKAGETFHRPEEKVTYTKQGELYTGYYNYVFKALKNTAGKNYGIMVTANEVTNQVLARQKIEEAEATIRGVVDLAQLGTWEVKIGDEVLHYSERLREWFGIDKDEVINSARAYDVIHPDDRAKVENAFNHAVTPGTDGIYDIEYRVNPKEIGRNRILHAQGKVSCNEKGVPVKVNGAVQDVTIQRITQNNLEQEVQARTEELEAALEELRSTNEELGESNERLLQSNEELSQYAYVASHDLQEPLRKIMFFSNMLEGKAGLNEKHQNLVHKIIASSERMSRLISDLLDFSRLQHHDKSAAIVKVDLNEICKEVTADFELTILEKEAKLIVEALPVIAAVKLQMNQLFYNLFSNALKFTDANRVPQIAIKSKAISTAAAALHLQKTIPEANYFEIIFADNGIGLEAEYVDHIFEPFKRLHGKDVYPGSGIGLAVCRKIVNSHGGYMYAQSVLGEGTSFHIILPEK